MQILCRSPKMSIQSVKDLLQSGLGVWLVGLAGVTIAVIVCVLWLDRPIAFLAYEWFGRHRRATSCRDARLLWPSDRPRLLFHVGTRTIRPAKRVAGQRPGRRVSPGHDHVRPSSPPVRDMATELTFPCKYVHFERTTTLSRLGAARCLRKASCLAAHCRRQRFLPLRADRVDANSAGFREAT